MLFVPVTLSVPIIEVLDVMVELPPEVEEPFNAVLVQLDVVVDVDVMREVPLPTAMTLVAIVQVVEYDVVVATWSYGLV